ncbi:MAG: CBS domain-containing protein [Candidatus Bathyarchaeia archaeon]
MPYLVKDYMVKDFPKVEEKTSAIDAARAMVASSRGFLIVLKEGRPEGIVTEHDFIEKIIARDLNPSKVNVGEIMSSPLITIDPDEDLLKASELMQKHRIRRLPVVKEGIIYGVVTTREISQRVGEYVERTIRDIMRWASPFGR